MKNENKIKVKIMIHLSSIMLFLLGLIVLHTIINNLKYTEQVIFFNIIMPSTVPFDVAIVCLAISFSMEFMMTFKPLKIVVEKTNDSI